MKKENAATSGTTRLNAEFGIEDHLRIRANENGLPEIQIKNEYASATIQLHGGHASRFRPVGEEPVLWMGRNAIFQRGVALRGGIPVCWPRFCDSAEGHMLAFHGFARTSEWVLQETRALPDGRTQVVLGLPCSEETFRLWPHRFELLLGVTVGAELETELSTCNTGETDFVFSEALHTYFNLSDIRKVSVGGLEKCGFIGVPAGTAQAEPITFEGCTDRIYLDTEADCVIDDPGFGRRIRVSKTGSRDTVVWNPWAEKAQAMKDFGNDEYLSMVCVEAVNAEANAITLKPGERHRLGSTLSVEALPPQS